ncbi:zinc finger CCCH domain-containing protein 14-like [Dendrobium catenatum]|uniref:zinc finger CCCH domain-containing protein 14-like n=1 Tax=Dendrobium catenatum TaxID=906689 RepID=UPI00109FE691|nr:zinc finger CCCH domain-containing protein 14-like [Dendrobium catenatum]
MYSHDATRKRGRPDATNGNGNVPSLKRSKEIESNQSSLGSKSKPCTNTDNQPKKYYSPPPLRNHLIGPTSLSDGPATPVTNTRLCNKYNTAEGCKFGDKCHFSHEERELGRLIHSALASTIIGKGGVNTKQVCHLIGAKLFIREHETNANLRNIKLEGTFDQIKQAIGMVRELIVNISSSAAPMPLKPACVFGAGGGNGGLGSNFKTKM